MAVGRGAEPIEHETTLAEALFEMKRAVVALHAEVPEAVATDVRERWNRVVAELKKEGIVTELARGGDL